MESGTMKFEKPEKKQESKQERCERCGEKLKKVKWLEHSNTDGNYYETIPHGHVSQGLFPFGVECATQQLIESRNNIEKKRSDWQSPNPAPYEDNSLLPIADT